MSFGKAMSFFRWNEERNVTGNGYIIATEAQKQWKFKMKQMMWNTRIHAMTCHNVAILALLLVRVCIFDIYCEDRNLFLFLTFFFFGRLMSFCDVTCQHALVLLCVFFSLPMTDSINFQRCLIRAFSIHLRIETNKHTRKKQPTFFRAAWSIAGIKIYIKSHQMAAFVKCFGRLLWLPIFYILLLITMCSVCVECTFWFRTSSLFKIKLTVFALYTNISGEVTKGNAQHTETEWAYKIK